MAKYKFAKDGHPYLTHGYPVLDEHGKEDARFSTYQLHPYAETLLREADFPEGGSLPRVVFYALLVEGNLYNEARPEGILITDVPWAMRWHATVIGDSLSKVLDDIDTRRPRQKFVLDVYRILSEIVREKAIAVTKTELLKGSSVLSLARLLKNQETST